MMSGNGRTGRILVIGGGITGITAAVEAAEAGQEVVLVEKRPYMGGRVAQLNQYFPKLCPPSCGLEINLRRFRTSPRIRCLTLAEVERISGEPGSYKVAITRSPRFVNEKCTGCGACAEVCPVERADEYNFGIGTTKAAYLPYDMAYPLQFAIDSSVCPGTECGKCIPACEYGAIELDMLPETIEVDVNAIVWATGWDPYDATDVAGLGFGTFKNVINNMMMERYASVDGPTAGKIQRPSDGKGIERVAFVQCAGSRDENYLKHCSGVCCLGSLKQARYVREQYPDAEIFVFYIDIRAPGRLEDFFVATKNDEKFHLIKGKVAKISEDSNGDLEVVAEDALSGGQVKQTVNLVVLATGMIPADGGDIQIEGTLEKDEHGFLTIDQSMGAVFAAGCAKRPTDVATSVRDAAGAVAKALHFCGE
jgi:quinone-modifying oxidoreductase subunit QmoA